MRPLALALAAAAVVACAPVPPLTVLPPPAAPQYAGYRSPRYADDALWLCRPDHPADRCHPDLSATEIHPDGSRTRAPFLPAAAPKVDCFYVYPTVDLALTPANHTDFTALDPMTSTAAAQFDRLGEVCQLYAPIYRQATIGSYLFGKEGLEARLAVGFSDVADAFAHYLGQYNQGRKIVLVGHSQGAEMVVRLLRRFFEGDPVLRERLLLAMVIGGTVEVPQGRLTGGTFTSIPVCSRPDELGCVVAFRTHREGSHFDPGPPRARARADVGVRQPGPMGGPQGPPQTPGRDGRRAAPLLPDLPAGDGAGARGPPRDRGGDHALRPLPRPLHRAVRGRPPRLPLPRRLRGARARRPRGRRPSI